MIHAPLRPFQIEFRRRARQGRNTLLVGDQGEGKTLAGLEAFGEVFEEGLGVFVVPRLNLCHQVEIEANEWAKSNGLPITIGSCTGLIDPQKREAVWKSNRLVICTGETFWQDIQAQRIMPGQLRLVIFDEADFANHRNQYCYNHIGRWLANYHHIQVLGLTALREFKQYNTICRTLGLDGVQDVPTNPAREANRYYVPYIVELGAEIDFLLAKISSGVNRIWQDLLSNELVKGELPTHVPRLGQLLAKITAISARTSQDKRVWEPLKYLHCVRFLQTLESILIGETLLEANERFQNSQSQWYLRGLRDFRQTQDLRKAVEDLAQSGFVHPKNQKAIELIANSSSAFYPTLVVCGFKSGIEVLSRLCRERNIAFEWVDAGLAVPNREEALRRFRDGEVNTLLSTSVTEMGTNIPDLRQVLICSLPQKRQDFRQWAGRAGRTDGSTGIISTVLADHPSERFRYRIFTTDPRNPRKARKRKPPEQRSFDW